jgi:hypothetical protein
MKRRWKLFLAGIAVLVLLVFFLPQGVADWEPPRVLRPLFDQLPHNKIYEICGRDIEFIFFVHDAATGEPISGAEFTIRDVDPNKSDRNDPPIHLVTDETGRAKLLRKDSLCEDVHRMFHKTVTLFFTAWCDFDLKAGGYEPIDNNNLGLYAHVDKGYSRQEKIHRVEYRIPLVKKD